MMHCNGARLAGPRGFCARFHLFTAGSLVMLLALAAGCGKSDSASGPASGSTGTAQAGGALPVGKARAGYVIGHVLGEDGKPIHVPGAKIRFAIDGISSKSGEKVTYAPAVRPDGAYEQRVVDGAYRFSMPTVDVPFNGKHFLYSIEPVGDQAGNDRDSAGGIVQDFVWKIRGLRPGADADNNFTHYYGGTVTAMFQSYREDLKRGVPKPPAGTKCVFTLTPQGRLIDGSEGKPMTFTREFEPLLSGLKDANLTDVPIANYTIRGEEIAPDGTRRPILIQQSFRQFGPATRVEFAPGASTGAWPVQIGFTLGAM